MKNSTRKALPAVALLALLSGVAGSTLVTSASAVAATAAETGSYVDQLYKKALALLTAKGKQRDAAGAAVLLAEAAKAGSVPAAMRLASLYVSGDGVKKNPRQAETILQGLAGGKQKKDANDALGDLYRNEPSLRDPVKAIAAYQAAVDAGNVSSLLKLAGMAASGDAGPVDAPRAAALLERYIALGQVASGADALGDLYLGGNPMHDAAKAAAAYQQAVDAGNSGAALKLARLLSSGDGIAVDGARANTLIQKAMAADPGRGNDALGDLYRAATPLRDPVKAAAAYRKAAASKYPLALVKLARMTAAGEGMKADPVKAIALVNQAIKAGEVRTGSDALGDLYAAEGKQHDERKAMAAYKAAADAGGTGAMIKLARMVADSDPARAEALFKQAIAAGDVDSGSDALGDLYRADGPAHDGAKAAVAYQRAAEAGKSGALVKLARMNSTGDGIPADPAKAKMLLEQAIAVGETRYGSEALADLLRADGPLRDPASAAAAYARAIDAGSTSAFLKLARLNSSGDGTPANPAAAKALVERAIASGDIRYGSDALGDLLHDDGPLHDPQAATAAYQRAIEAGNTGAVLKLARMLATGDGVPADAARAKTLIDQAIAGGDVQSGSDVLGDLYRADNAMKSPEKAVDAYKAAIAAGNDATRLKLGRLLVTGDGVPPDPAAAKALFDAAVAAGDLRYGNDALGDLYSSATSLRDPAAAAAAYRKAAEAGATGAMLKLARMTAAGESMAADPAAAKALVDKAIVAGDVRNGADALGDLLRADTPLRDPVAAAAAYQKAVDAGNGKTRLKLAQMAAAGDGMPADKAKAQALIEAAIKDGQARAGNEALGDLFRSSSPAQAAAAYQAAIDAGSVKALSRLARMTLSNKKASPAEIITARTLLERAVAAGDVANGALALGDLYSKQSPTGASRTKALAYYQQSADAGNVYAHLAAARLNGTAIRSAADRQSMVGHLVNAARLWDAPRVAGEVMRFPPETLMAAVQEMLVEGGAKLVVNGAHGRTTEQAIEAFCAGHPVADCNPKFVSVDLLTALLTATTR